MKCGKHGHELTNPKCPENNEKKEKEESVKRKHVMESAPIATENGIEFKNVKRKRKKMRKLKRL